MLRCFWAGILQKHWGFSEQFDNKLFTQNSNCEPAPYDHLLTSPIVLRRLQYFHNRGKIISHLTPSIESFHQTHFWPCIIHGYSSPTLAQGGSALSQSPSQDISLLFIIQQAGARPLSLTHWDAARTGEDSVGLQKLVWGLQWFFFFLFLSRWTQMQGVVFYPGFGSSMRIYAVCSPTLTVVFTWWTQWWCRLWFVMIMMMQLWLLLRLLKEMKQVIAILIASELNCGKTLCWIYTIFQLITVSFNSSASAKLFYQYEQSNKTLLISMDT